jgi:hypothetical protein
MTHPRKILSLAAFVATVVLFPCSFAKADTLQYSYTGNAFTVGTLYLNGSTYSGLLCPGCSIQINLDFSAPLAADLSFGAVTPDDGWGVHVIGTTVYDTYPPGGSVWLATGSTGAISEWQIMGSDNLNSKTFLSADYPGKVEDAYSYTVNTEEGGSNFNMNDPGTWTCTDLTTGGSCPPPAPTPAVPEPASLVLLGTGLLALASIVRGSGPWSM